MSSENNIGMREVEAPDNAFRKIPKAKVIGLIALIVVPLAIATPFIIEYLTTRDQREIVFQSLDLVASTEANETNDATATFAMHFEYLNAYEEPFTINRFSVDLALKQENVNDWTDVLTATSTAEQSIARRGYSNLTVSFTIEENEPEKIQLLERILMKSADSLQFEGELRLSRGVERVPDLINFRFEEELHRLFDYNLPGEGPSTFLIVDLHSIGPNQADPTLLDLGVDSIYENPFDFPITLKNTSMRVTNRTSETGWGAYSFEPDVSIESRGNTSIFAQLALFPDEISFIVSDLLNGSRDTFYLRQVSAQFSVGNLSISGYRENEVAASKLVFELTIDSFGLASGGRLQITAKIVNPCNLIFNISYLKLDMFVKNTQNKVLEIDQAIGEVDGKILVEPYSATYIEDLVLDVSYTNFIQNLDNNFDLYGYLIADCYNFEGYIYFGSTDVDLGL